MKINLYNVSQFILGHVYYYAYCFKLLPKYIRAQFTRRLLHRSCVNTCLYECRGCGCKIPEVLFAPKACKKGNYPALIWDRKSWEILAQSIHDFEIHQIAECKEEFKRLNPKLKEDQIKYNVQRSFYGDIWSIKTEIYIVEEHDEVDLYLTTDQLRPDVLYNMVVTNKL